MRISEMLKKGDKDASKPVACHFNLLNQSPMT